MQKGAKFPELKKEDIIPYNETMIGNVWEVCDMCHIAEPFSLG